MLVPKDSLSGQVACEFHVLDIIPVMQTNSIEGHCMH